LFSVKVITPPVDFPITLGGARDFLQVTDTSEDALINFILASAVDYAEQYMQRALMPRTILESFSCWPSEGHYLRWNPLLDISHIKYYDEAGILQTLSPSQYTHYTSQDIACLLLRPSVIFPQVADRPDAIQVTYRAGYEPTGTIPGSIYHAICLELRHGFDFRTNEKLDSSPYRIASERLMNAYIIYTYRS
jgi:uncharacterized phiE125 gp8 family phage protein